MIIDIVVIAIIALAGFLGYKKGLIDMVVGIASIILAFVLAIILQNYVSNFLIEKTSLGGSVETQIEDSLKKTLLNNEKDELSTETDITENSSEQSENKEDKKEVKKQNDEIKGFIESFVKEEIISDNIPIIANNITKFIFKGISFIGIFVVVIIITYIIRMILNLVFELPLLNSVNKFGGLGLGIIKGLLWIFIIFAVLRFIEPMGIDKVVVDYINTSIVSKFLYNTNFIVLLIKGDLKF